MSEDIRKWSDGRYTLMFDEHTFFVWDNENEKRMTALQTTKKLNEQQATITALKKENEHLRKELDNFKPVLFNDIRKGTVILYSKGERE